MSKPSDDIKLIIEKIYQDQKSIEKVNLGTADLYVIIQAVIHYLDINASLAEEKRKAFAAGKKRPSEIWE